MNTQQKKESLGLINRLFKELDAEVEKWEQDDDYNIANDLSGGHISIESAIESIELNEELSFE